MAQTPPIVLIHGAWHGAWCWADVAGVLRSRGHEVVVLTLPGHDRPGDRRRIWATASSYVQALAEAVDRLDAAPVLVGHSMGGYVVQRYLREHRARGAVLLASAPRRGALRVTFSLLRRKPRAVTRAMLTADLWPPVSRPGDVRSLFFGPDAPEAGVSLVEDNIQNESFLAYLALALRWSGLRDVESPTLVLAAREDAVFTVAEQQDLAHALAAPLEVIEGSGHDLMLDARWRQVADRIDQFVTTVA